MIDQVWGKLGPSVYMVKVTPFPRCAVEGGARHLGVKRGLKGHRAGDEGGEPDEICRGHHQSHLQA